MVHESTSPNSRRDPRHTRLEDIEWHDLPLSSLCIDETSLSLTVTPYSEGRKRYDTVVLRLSAYSVLAIELQSELTLADQTNLEVAHFEYELVGEERLSGRLEILPGRAGYWVLRFENALWELADV